MTLHVFATFLTPHGTAANNRGENAGNTTTLQKILWQGKVHSTVSAEAIRFALRRRLGEWEECNRTFDEDSRGNRWRDAAFKAWGAKSKDVGFIDDDLLGFMVAEGAKEEGGKGQTTARRAVLEVTRAVSIGPWPGDVTFNAASPGATPSAQKKGSNPVPYATEMHATRYQYSIALTPSTLRRQERAALALRALCSLGPVAGNHGRFLFDFSPESVVFRVTQDPAPRILYAFTETQDRLAAIPDLVRKVVAGDIAASELVMGGAITESLSGEARENLAGATLLPGVVAACEAVCTRLTGA
jgi:CRISPR-associated protein Cst2